MSQVTPLGFEDALFAAFNAYWAGQAPVAWPNIPYDPDDNVDAYVEFQILGREEGQVPVGTSVNAQGAYTRAGTVAVSIYQRQGTGTARAYTLADDVGRFFEPAASRAVANAVFGRISTPQPVGPDGTWWQLLMTASFTYFTDRG